MTLAEVGNTWREAGVSVIPIAPNFLKRPPLPWKPYQGRIATLDEVSEWWGNGHAYGLALICGGVSHGLEMTEVEGRAMKSGGLVQIFMACDELGCSDILDRLMNSYTQESPSGGLHLFYRIADHEVPGNTKLALNEDRLVLAETRGEGGYVIGAPSPGTCHPSGVGWRCSSGVYGELEVITWDERCRLHAAITKALDRSGLADKPVVPPQPTRQPGTDLTSPGHLSPGDDFALRVDWEDILIPAGWQLHSVRGGERFWTRPGKNMRDGFSASTDYEGKPGLFVWSTSADLPTENPLSKLFVLAHYRFGGDMARCARSLQDEGFGTRRPVTQLDDIELFGTVEPEQDEPSYTFDDVGNTERLLARTKGRFVYHAQEKVFYRWTGISWERDVEGDIMKEMVRETDDMMSVARERNDEVLAKWAKTSRSQARLNAAVGLAPSLGAARDERMFDPDRHLLNVHNGVLSLETFELAPHDPGFMMTRVARASYQAAATCPRFEQFMEQILPNADVRDYVQRALGYTLLGDADQRALFVAYGPSGTGKSTLMEIMRLVLGDYAAVAPAGTFKHTREKGPSNDLHRLRGRRFVTSSETAESASFDEDLLKRITGRDQITSRELYQEFREWTPEMVLWLATNHPPRFSSDDEALWRRVKMVPFTTQLVGDGEIADYARRFLLPEADGILAWLVRGLQAFLKVGLKEPEVIRDGVRQLQLQADNVARFLEDSLADSLVIEDEAGVVTTRDMFILYSDWCRVSGEKPYGSRRFIQHIEQTGRATYQRDRGRSVWLGLRKVGLIQTWGTPQIGQ